LPRHGLANRRLGPLGHPSGPILQAFQPPKPPPAPPPPEVSKRCQPGVTFRHPPLTFLPPRGCGPVAGPGTPATGPRRWWCTTRVPARRPPGQPSGPGCPLAEIRSPIRKGPPAERRTGGPGAAAGTPMVAHKGARAWARTRCHPKPAPAVRLGGMNPCISSWLPHGRFERVSYP